ncbi:hypothetical protein TanjilG_28960 [Lupinus angustifolius]|uniref:Uncharacterized protein n=1 Tax=Lupinus angustifolius TaxID=3871 RepID=A0A4P1RTC2_LUPAN|nr:PREDICTED: uncharacterized protein LOC109325172 [Lupinus angustifolius]OIW17610.1 hypothetical protein TanjilG_28960 [Lupinus angustifolius]
MGPDREQKSKSENNHAPAFSVEKVLESVTDYMSDACDMETSPIKQNPLSSGETDVEVNITGCTNAGKALVVEDSCEDVTECSSSFGDTGSGTENASFSDNEVESRTCADNGSSSMCDDWCGALRRRKKRTMATHWRRFIGPLMWRCKWIELKLEQLRSQELKYVEELAAYNYTKQLDFAHLTLDGFDIKSVPISGRMRRNKVMKRNKRKRVEEECDLASYMSNHNLFSYFEKTDRNTDACLKDFHGVSVGGNDENIQEFKLSDMWASIDYGTNDKSLDEIIQKIEAVKSQVREMKTRTDKVVSENPGNFHSVAHLSMLGSSDGFNHSDLNCASLADHQNTTQVEYPTGELPMHGNASSSRERLSPVIEISDGSDLEEPWKDTKDGVLVQHHAVKEELHDFENVRTRLVQKTSAAFEESKPISQFQVSAPDMAIVDAAVRNVHLSLKPCSTIKSNAPRDKRKGRKKGSLKRLSQR